MSEAKIPSTIAELFRIPSQFLRSVQLERDFDHPLALEGYVVTQTMANAFGRIVNGLAEDTGRRAWRLTGDYGVGKSAFALVLARLLAGRRDATVQRIASEAGFVPDATKPTVPLRPVLLTGSRTSLVPAIARCLAAAVVEGKPDARRASFYGRIATLKSIAEASGTIDALEALLEAVRDEFHRKGAGLLLIVDELGKHLEHAAMSPEREDVFVLQRLAEMASRSGGKPFVLICILHQGFQAYAERLGTRSRNEWDKIAGRFDEIVFDQPLAHTAAIVRSALDIDAARIPEEITRTDVGVQALVTGWFGSEVTDELSRSAATFYPLHPTLLPVIVRFFGRFGQNERSMFGFLLSAEPFGLQAYAAKRSASNSNWYGLTEFYDYVRASFGHRLSGGSYRSQWLRIQNIVDSASDRSVEQIAILKIVAVLNLLDAEDLLSTADTVRACLPLAQPVFDAAFVELRREGVLFERGRGGVLRLWPGSSVALDDAVLAADRSMSPIDRVAPLIDGNLDRNPVLARRHYIETGSMRYFDIRYVQVEDATRSASTPFDGDGLILVVLADTEAERRQGIEVASSQSLSAHPDVLVCVGQPLSGLLPELREVVRWKWVSENTPELVEDTFAAAEVFRQLSAARSALAVQLRNLLGTSDAASDKTRWFRSGEPVTLPERGGVSAAISGICDDLFPLAPRISNELLNRNQLSSAASAARMRLIEGLLTAGDRPLLGIDDQRSPPEKSMYMSVLQKGLVHVPTAEAGFRVVEPGVARDDALASADPLNLGPSLAAIIRAVEEARGDRVPILDLFERLKARPFGVRMGVVPLLLAIVFTTRMHELALYENGTFLHRFGPSDFLRMTKMPSAFQVQLCRVEGVRLDVFRKLSETFASTPQTRHVDLLDVVRPLCRFAAQLPEYTRRTKSISATAASVRDALLAAREPYALLFVDLPKALDLESVPTEEDGSSGSILQFIDRLEEAVAELRDAYPLLLRRIVDTVADATVGNRDAFSRVELAAVAADVSSVAREPRLKAFAGRLRDPGLSDDAWAEALASFVVSKPPSKWVTGDEPRFADEATVLGRLFRRAEEASFVNGERKRSPDSILLNLTRGDGEDETVVLKSGGGDHVLPTEIVDLLPKDRTERLRLLVDVLWSELRSGDKDAASEPFTEAGQARGIAS